MSDLTDALYNLKSGNFVLIHDSKNRENETDFVIAGEKITPEHISRMRNDCGGLICAAISERHSNIGLPFFDEIRSYASEKFKILEHMAADDLKYDTKSAFTVNINYRKTFTGISDIDRSMTIRKLAEFFTENGKNENIQKLFGLWFRSPGHVPVLLSRGIANRRGHTEFSTALSDAAGMSGVVAICEMLDNKTHGSLSPEKAEEYARKHELVFLDVETEIKNLEKIYVKTEK